VLAVLISLNESKAAMRKILVKTIKVLKRFLFIFLFILSSASVMGIIVYGLFRVAVFNKRIYSFLFVAVCAVVLFYFTCRAVRRKNLSSVLLKIAKPVVVIIAAGTVLSAVMLFGGFIIRYPVLGSISAPFLIFSALYFIPKVKISSLFKK